MLPYKKQLTLYQIKFRATLLNQIPNTNKKQNLKKIFIKVYQIWQLEVFLCEDQLFQQINDVSIVVP